MAGRRAGAGLALAALALTAAGCGLGGGTKTVTVTRTHTVTKTVTVTTNTTSTRTLPLALACTGDQLTGTFSIVAGSAAAGQVSYTLTLKNTSGSHCYVSGLPAVVLLGSTGSPLPTHTVATGSGAAAQVVLAPGATAQASARFSPDVPGQGDSQHGACQPSAHTLQVTPDGGGAVAAPISPRTSVCEQGTLDFGAYH